MSRAGAVVFVASALALAGCTPLPDPADREVCGYRCGPMQACPDGFACYADGRCHREGSPETRGCTLDGGPDTPPSISNAQPTDNEPAWPPDEAFRIVFDEPVFGVDASSITLRHRSEFTPVPITVSYSTEDRTATVVPGNPLDIGATYVITVASMITDATGNPFTGRSWEFTTVTDRTPPGIATVTPTPGSMDVGVETPIVISFDEPVFGVTQSSFTVQDSAGHSAGDITYVSPMLVKRTGQWTPNTLYTVTLTSAVTDLTANPLQGAPHTWFFRTGADTVPPRLTYQRPRANEDDVLVHSGVVLNFSEPVIGYTRDNMFLEADGVRVPATISNFGDARALDLVPDEPFKSHTTYRMTILPTVTDVAGNPIVPGVLSWTFTTESVP